jgi:hypothetical protein
MMDLPDAGVWMTQTMRAWRKANAYVRSGQHEKAIRWLIRTHAILEREPPQRRPGDGMNASYALGALVVLFALWVATGFRLF